NELKLCIRGRALAVDTTLPNAGGICKRRVISGRRFPCAFRPNPLQCCGAPNQRCPRHDGRYQHNTSASSRLGKPVEWPRSCARQLGVNRQSVEALETWRRTESSRASAWNTLTQKMDGRTNESPSLTPQRLAVSVKFFLDMALNGQTARRGLEVHFPRYHFREESECQAFRNVLLTLLTHVPLRVDQAALLQHWPYFYAR